MSETIQGWRSYFPRIPKFVNASMSSTQLMTLNVGSPVDAVAFSADRSHIVSGSWDESVWVWDALTGKEKLVLDGHTAPVSSVASSTDGGHIVSGSGDNSICVWPQSPQTKTCHYIWEQVITSAQSLNHTGWLLSPFGEGYLMFVPLSENLPDDANILTIPSSAVGHVDFSDAKLGLEWGSGYIPVQPY